MNLETYLFWGLILFFAVGGVRMKFVAALSLTVSSMVAVYLGFWQIKHYSILGELIPMGYAEYVNPCLFIILFFLSFFFLQLIFKRVNAIYERNLAEASTTESTIFSKWFLLAGTMICNALTGVAMTTLIFLVVAVLPLAEKVPQISVKNVASLGSSGMYFVSAVVDTFSLCSWQQDKKEVLMHQYLNSEEMEAEEVLKKM